MFAQPSVDPTLMPTLTMRSQLAALEQKISTLNQHQHFTAYVLAVYEIATKRLYRLRSDSLEAYFKTYHCLSRAQVYRLIDCGQVITDLVETPANPDLVLRPLPNKQRLYKTIKTLAPTRQLRQLLWSVTLRRKRRHNITSKHIISVWNALRRQNFSQTDLSSPPPSPTNTIDPSMTRAYMSDPMQRRSLLPLTNEYKASGEREEIAAMALQMLPSSEAGLMNSNYHQVLPSPPYEPRNGSTTLPPLRLDTHAAINALPNKPYHQPYMSIHHVDASTAFLHHRHFTLPGHWQQIPPLSPGPIDSCTSLPPLRDFLSSRQIHY